MRLGYQPALDGLRGVAILCVVFSHTFKWPNGSLGVQLFFVLSGFLITTLLLDEWSERGRISLRHFYARRALRLVPAVVVALVFFLLLSGIAIVLDAPHAHRPVAFVDSLRSALVGLGYVANLAQAHYGLLPAAGVRHLWSLATEEQFYLVWPITLVVALRMGARTRALLSLLGVAIAVIALHRLDETVHGASDVRLLMGPDVDTDGLLLGCLLGVWYADRPMPSAGGKRILAHAYTPATALIVLVLAFTTWHTRLLYDGGLLVFSAAAVVVLLTALRLPESWLVRLLTRPRLVYVGRISYGLYVWHGIVMATTGFIPPLAGAVLSIGIAAVSYRYVETPFLRRKASCRPAVEAPTAQPGLAAV